MQTNFFANLTDSNPVKPLLVMVVTQMNCFSHNIGNIPLTYHKLRRQLGVVAEDTVLVDTLKMATDYQPVILLLMPTKSLHRNFKYLDMSQLST